MDLRFNRKKEKKKFELTKRDILIVQLISKGKTMSEIGEMGGVSGRTVEFIVSGLQRQYKCNNNAHLAATFIRKGIIK